MDTRTGRIYTPEEMEEINKSIGKSNTIDAEKFASMFRDIPKDEYPKVEDLKEMVVPPTSKQMKTKKVGRNDLCPCGSGKKFKKCCLK